MQIEPTTIYYAPAQPFTLWSVREFLKVGAKSPNYEKLVFTFPQGPVQIVDRGMSWDMSLYFKPQEGEGPVVAAVPGPKPSRLEHPTKVYRDTSNWMFSKQEIAQCCAEVLVPDMNEWHDCFTDGKGPVLGNAQCPSYYSIQDDCFSHLLAGKNFIANPVYRNEFIHGFFTKFWRDCRTDPENTRLLVVLPEIPGATWWHNTTRLRRIRSYPQKSQVFS